VEDFDDYFNDPSSEVKSPVSVMLPRNFDVDADIANTPSKVSRFSPSVFVNEAIKLR